MTKKRVTVANLAQTANFDLDETLIRLWDTGIEDVIDPTDELTGKNVKKAMRALRIPSRHEITLPRYWQQQLGLNIQQFNELLLELNIHISPSAKSLPKGSIKKLKRCSKQTNFIEPHLTPTPKLLPKLEWSIIGHLKELRMLTTQEVQNIHFLLVDDFSKTTDPIIPSGIRDNNLLESAVFRPQTAIGESTKYPTVEMSAAALLHSLVHNHPFHNGNKRTALVSMLVFLDENGFMLTCDETALFKEVLQVAQHKITEYTDDELSDREVLAISRWINSNCRRIENADRPLPFRRLQDILQEYDCRFEFGSSGGKVNITRTIRPGPRHQTVLKTQIHYDDQGREVSKKTINKVRDDLQLNDANGYDSGNFYNTSPRTAGEFIIGYRKTLTRLSRL